MALRNGPMVVTPEPVHKTVLGEATQFEGAAWELLLITESLFSLGLLGPDDGGA